MFISPVYDVEHFRWIRLGQRAFTLDAGVELFERWLTTKPSHVAIFDGGKYLTLETQLKSLASERGAVITARPGKGCAPERAGPAVT